VQNEVRNRAGRDAAGGRGASRQRASGDLLLQAGADPNAAEMPAVVTPLHLAAARGHAEIAQTLLRHRAAVDAADAAR